VIDWATAGWSTVASGFSAAVEGPLIDRAAMGRRRIPRQRDEVLRGLGVNTVAFLTALTAQPADVSS